MPPKNVTRISSPTPPPAPSAGGGVPTENGKRPYQPREMRLLSEWLAITYPKDQVITRFKLGRPHPSLVTPKMSAPEFNLAGVWRRWADAVVIKRDRLILIEAAILPNPGKVSQLALYEKLIPHTPELGAAAKLPIEKVMLVAVVDPVTVAVAKDADIRVVVYRPAWIQEYLLTLAPRRQRAPLTVLPK